MPDYKMLVDGPSWWRDRAIRQESIWIGNTPLGAYPWTPASFDGSKLKSVWVSIKGFPVKLWSENEFVKLIEGFGILLEVDEHTTDKSYLVEANIRIGVCCFTDIPTSKPIVYRNDRNEKCWREVRFSYELPRIERPINENNNKRKRVWREKPSNSTPTAPGNSGNYRHRSGRDEESGENEFNSQESQETGGVQHEIGEDQTMVVNENNSHQVPAIKDKGKRAEESHSQVIYEVGNCLTQELQIVPFVCHNQYEVLAEGQEEGGPLELEKEMTFDKSHAEEFVENDKRLRDEFNMEGPQLSALITPSMDVTVESESAEQIEKLSEGDLLAFSSIISSPDQMASKQKDREDSFPVMRRSQQEITKPSPIVRQSLRLKINKPEVSILSKAKKVKLSKEDYLAEEEGLWKGSFEKKMEELRTVAQNIIRDTTARTAICRPEQQQEMVISGELLGTQDGMEVWQLRPGVMLSVSEGLRGIHAPA